MIQNNEIYVENDLTSYYFYNELLKDLHDYFEMRSKNILSINIGDIEKIDSEVIPNLLCLGSILKDYYGLPIKLFVPWKPNIISYLSDIGFINIVSKYNIFDFDTKLFDGGFVNNRINRNSKSYCFEENCTKDYISYNLESTKNSLKECFLEGNYETDMIIESLHRMLIELCHNSSNYSFSKCFVTSEINRKRNSLNISISDFGIGMYKSISRKFEENKWSLKINNEEEFRNTSEKGVNGILEAIFHRQGNEEYGIYQSIKTILQNNGTVRIHSDEIQIIMKKNQSLKSNTYDFMENKEKFYDYLIKKLELCDSGILQSKFSSIRRINKFAGVHYEITIPLDNSRYYEGGNE